MNKPVNPALNPTKRPSLFDRLCQPIADGSLPPTFHVPLQQYALSGVETDRILTDAEQEIWRNNATLSYILNKRKDYFFVDSFIPSFLSPALLDWMNEVESNKNGLPITRFMRLLNRIIIPYDRLYELDNPRSAQRFLTDMVTTFDVISSLPPPMQPHIIFDVLATPASGLPQSETPSFPLSKGMAHIWRYMIRHVPFEPANQIARADFLVKFFQLFEATPLDRRLIPPTLLAYLNAPRYKTSREGLDVTGLMMEIFCLAGIRDDQSWQDPAFATRMAEQFFREAYASLILPESVVAWHDTCAKNNGFTAKGQSLSLKQGGGPVRFIWKKSQNVECRPDLAHVNIIACDDTSSQSRVLTQGLTAMAKTAAIPHTVLPSFHDPQRRRGGDEKPSGPVNLFACPLDRLCDFIMRRGLHVFEDRYNIAYTSWGTDRLPQIAKVVLPLLEEIWVQSHQQRELFQKETDKPVQVVSVPVNRLPAAPTITKAALDFPENTFLFLTVFDAADWMSRKNPIAVLKAFQMAFKANEKVGLIVKTRNVASKSVAAREEGHLARLQKIWRADHRIIAIHDEYTDAEMAGLHNLANAYISLPRSSAFDASLAEAMIRGRPVITTNKSGVCDYTNTDNALLIPSVPCSVVFDAYHFLDKEVEHHWHDPDIFEAAKAMRRVYEGGAAIQQMAENGQHTVQNLYNEATCSARMKTRLDQIMQGLVAEKAA